MKLYVDFDTIIYRYAISLQKTTVEVSYKDNGVTKVFKNITEFRGRNKKEPGGWFGDVNVFFNSNFLLKDCNINKKTKIILKDNVAHKHITAYVEELKQDFEEVKIIVGGNNNYRYKIFPNYKKDRGEKPLRLLQVKDWTINNLENVVVADGCEADDYCSIIGWWAYRNKKDDVVIGGCDKDLLQIPGKHWNYDKREEGIIEVDIFTAHHNLCKQLLLGDVTDGIKGLPLTTSEICDKYNIKQGGVGKIKTEQILSNINTIEGLYRAVEECYKSYYKEEWKSALNQTYQLVKLMEKKGVIPTYEFS